ncbi:MAG: thiamine phosphate synthase [Acidiferrobacter sp.]
MKVAGLYLLTDARSCTPDGRARLEMALGAGTSLLQLRCKGHAMSVTMAADLVALGHRYGVPVIVNDDPELAAQAGADGVHLGATDGSIRAARARLGRAAIIGASCYASLERAAQAAQAGADYLAFGSFYPSVTKPQAAPAPLAILTAARRWGRPLVAIGGIVPENGAAVLAAGADALAVITGVFNRVDITAAVHAYVHLFKERHES